MDLSGIVAFVMASLVAAVVVVAARPDDLDDFNEEEALEATVCPACRVFNNLTCHIEGVESYGHCSCPVCVTKCPIVDNPCPRGAECVLQYMGCNFPPCSVPSATCIPFAGCQKFDCDVCKTGYVLDHNNCQTCLCKDPCQELDCKEDKVCTGEVHSGQDPKYYCGEGTR